MSLARVRIMGSYQWHDIGQQKRQTMHICMFASKIWRDTSETLLKRSSSREGKQDIAQYLIRHKVSRGTSNLMLRFGPGMCRRTHLFLV